MSNRCGIPKIFIWLILCCCICLWTNSDAQENAVLDSVNIFGSDSVYNKKLTINAYPYAFYSPETQLAFGAGGIMVFYTDKEFADALPSKLGFGGYYTTSKQYKISVNPALYFAKNKLYISTPASFGFFVDKFWGIGNSTSESGTEQYTKQVISASFLLQSPPIVFAAKRSGLILDYDNTTIKDKKENEYLLQDSVSGSNGGEIFGVGFDLTWDNRDNIFFPNTGGYQYLKFIVYPGGVSDYNFGQFELDVRHYWAPSPDHVIAANFYVLGLTGDPPFYKLAALGGGKRMRGYFMGRYRDKFYATFQMEYRQYFWRKWGFVVFGAIGDVASSGLKFGFSNIKYSYGAGLRFLFNKAQKINLRADIGFGRDGNSGVYFGIEEAF